MSESKILRKLEDRLKEFPQTEDLIVFILSRVRKIIEMNNYPDKYSELNFYCNLVLHSKLTRPPRVIKEQLHRIISGKDYSNTIIGFSGFQTQFKQFLNDHNLPDPYLHSSPQQRKVFYRALLEICSDIPVTVTYDGSDYVMNIEILREEMVISFSVPRVIASFQGKN